MTSRPPQATPQVLLHRILSGVARVFVVPVSADGQLLLLRHDSHPHVYWTYPTMQRGTIRTNPATVARRLLREELGVDNLDGLRLVHILEASRTHARSAVYTIGLPQAAADIISAREAAGIRRHAMQALVVTAETLAVLDVRPRQINELLTCGGSPAQRALSLPDLAVPTT